MDRGPAATTGGAAPRDRPVVLWRFKDGARGHENQTLGLIRALSSLVCLEVHDVAVSIGSPRPLRRLHDVRHVLAHLPDKDPDLMVGAGHRTHLAMVLAARARGGRTVVLMKPSLPLRWFDLCLVPRHDRLRPRPNLLLTRGALNAAYPAGDGKADRGLVLVGGPSKHFGWDDERLIESIGAIAEHSPAMQWTVATSPRTPPQTLAKLSAMALPNGIVVGWEAVAADWLMQRLAGSHTVWVTRDSANMVYEALTAGAATGLLPVPERRRSRISAAMDRLCDEGLVTGYGDWCRGRPLAKPAQPLNEAARCARWIKEHWLDPV